MDNEMNYESDQIPLLGYEPLEPDPLGRYKPVNQLRESFIMFLQFFIGAVVLYAIGFVFGWMLTKFAPLKGKNIILPILMGFLLMLGFPLTILGVMWLWSRPTYSYRY